MTRPTIAIHNLETNEIIEREMNDEEFAKYQSNIEKELITETEVNSRAAQRRAILEHLKITEEEARILLGGN